MWDRIRGVRSQVEQYTEGLSARPARRPSRRPLVELLEDRQLLTSASLQTLSNLTVPAQQGYTLPLLADSSQTDAQTYTVTSSNPDIAASIATGPFWNLGVSYTDPNNSANNFSGNLNFQLFQQLTPNTVTQISNLTNNGYYVNVGKYFNRVLQGFVVQGGSPTLTGSEPNPPVTFANEDVQQLAFTGVYQLAMANAGGTDSNTSQFFITLPSTTTNFNTTLGYNYTIFGQLLTGVNTVTQMSQVPVMSNTSTGEVSQPDNPLTISSATLTNSSPDGVLLIDTTQAVAGESSNITVTATDPTNGTTTSQTFVVTTSAYAGPTDPTINFRPYATSFSAASTSIQLQGRSGYPDPATPGTITYKIVSQPLHGTITNFNASTGTLTYSEEPGYSGPVSFQYETVATGPETTPATTMSNPATVTLNVTGAVTVVGTTLVITPAPTKKHHKNAIVVSQVTNSSGTSVIQTTVNGVIDPLTVSTASIDSITIFGGKKARNQIDIDPSVTLPANASGGQGYINYIRGGGGETREHGWFGYSILAGGVGPNELVGRAGHVKFKPSSSTIEIFAGVPHKRTSDLNPTPPGGTYYKYVKGRLVPVYKY